jgi:hypothetical protein
MSLNGGQVAHERVLASMRLFAKRGQDRRQASRQHRLARAGRTDQQHVADDGPRLVPEAISSRNSRPSAARTLSRLGDYPVG